MSSSPSSRSSDPVGKFLAKTVRKASPPSPKLNKVRPCASVEDCVELCRLLLEKVGADSQTNDSAHVEKLLLTEYPPGVADLLGKITGTLDIDGLLDSVSDVTDSSDDEFSSPSLSSSVPSPVLAKGLSELEQIPEIHLVKKPTSTPTEYKADTEIAVSRIFQLGKFSAVQDPSIPANAPYNGPSVVTMTGFGELGRFGNQVLQYAFLKSYATAHNIAEIQVPHWIGADIFGLNDSPVQRAFPSVVEFSGTLANSTFTDDLINYVKNSSATYENDETSMELGKDILDATAAPSNVDIWGWFQWNTAIYSPFKKVLRETFEPNAVLKDHMESIFNSEIRYRGGIKRTVIGIHLRYGDYQNIAASSFGYCAPTSWYLEWLSKIWDTVENPLLVVTSDDLKSVVGDFSEYDMVTTASAGLDMPEEFRGMKAGFFPDWYALTQCDVLAISNSTFSFSASLMNTRENLHVYRAHYAHKLTEITPWNAEPIVHRDTEKNALQKGYETIKILYNTQGMPAVLRNVMYELPCYGVRALVMKAVLWRSAKDKVAAIEGAA